MLIEKKNAADLLPAEYNPRKDLKPGDLEYEKLRRSIEQFGYVEPVIWNKATGRVVGGHQRLKVLMDMGITEVDCVVVDMPEDKEKALNIALNKISGEWDKEKLALLITDLQGVDFDVSLTGFEPAEIDDLFKDTIKDGVKDDEFDVEAELQNPTFSKVGDVWTLGRHRLVCALASGGVCNASVVSDSLSCLGHLIYVGRKVHIGTANSKNSHCYAPFGRLVASG